MNLYADDYKITKPLRLIELFAGYGSQAMAFERIGAKFEHWFVCEFDKYAIKSYNAVHGTSYDVSDIRNVHAADLNIIDRDKYCYFMTYSFPCTDLSLAGKRMGMSKGSGTRSSLLWEVERLLNELGDNLPDVLFMENVSQVSSKQNRPDFEEWIKYLNNKGYSNCFKVLNAKNYGIPQNRERAYMFSFLGNYDYEFPEPLELKKCMKDCLEPQVDEKYYINTGKAKELIQKLLKDIQYKQIPVHVKNAVIETVDFSLKNPKRIKVAHCISARNDRGISNLEGEGSGVFECRYIVAMRGRNPENPKSRVAGLPTEQRLEPRFDSCSNNQYRIRKLTPLECFRLMDVTDEDAKKMLKVNSNTQCYKQAGNSIVVGVMAAMFGKLF